MSLLPAERRALNKIEDSLRHSDPRLARMLNRFTVPIARGGLMVLAHRLGTHRRLILVLAVLVAGLAALVIMHGPSRASCPRTRGSPSVAADTQFTSCPPGQRPVVP